MHSEYAYLMYIAIILLAAKVGGIISKKLKQPAVLGQIVMGIVLGAGLLEHTELVDHLAQIGVIFLMFIAGLETDVKELKESSKSSSLIALGGVVFPLALVAGGSYLLNGNYISALFLGIVATATSVSISVQTLREIGRLRSRQGVSILGAAIIDDIVGIILLTLAVGVINPAEGNSLYEVVGKIVLFFVVTFVVGYVIMKIFDRFKDFFYLEDKSVTFAIVTCFVLAFLSEELGVAAITGAYFAGVVFSMTTERHKVSHDINKMSSYIFTPIFFVAIGMSVDLRVAGTALGLGFVLIVLAALGKVLGSGLGARFSGFSKEESLQIGIGMVPRAEVAIIIANLGVRMNMLTHHDLAAVILMVLVTTLVTPSLLKWSFERK